MLWNSSRPRRVEHTLQPSSYFRHLLGRKKGVWAEIALVAEADSLLCCRSKVAGAWEFWLFAARGPWDVRALASPFR